MKFDFDFGFTAMDETELKAAERELLERQQQEITKVKQQVVETVQAKDQVENEYYAKLEQLRDMIMPLLAKLQEDPQKNYLFWPNRVEKLKLFADRINKFVDEA